MSIEVRQLMLKCKVCGDEEADVADVGKAARTRAIDAEEDEAELCERLKKEIFAACQVWIQEQLRAFRER